VRVGIALHAQTSSNAILVGAFSQSGTAGALMPCMRHADGAARSAKATLNQARIPEQL